MLFVLVTGAEKYNKSNKQNNGGAIQSMRGQNDDAGETAVHRMPKYSIASALYIGRLCLYCRESRVPRSPAHWLPRLVAGFFLISFIIPHYTRCLTLCLSALARAMIVIT